MLRISFKLVLPGLLALMLFACKPKAQTEWMPRPEGFESNYTLEQMVVLSRHNVRTPLVGKGSILPRVTDSTYEWHHWSEETSHLTAKGERLEAKMGGFFRQWLLKKNLLQAYEKDSCSFRFYANAKQRCQQTAKTFAEALQPGAGAKVEMKAPYNTMDPVFHPQITKNSSAFVKKAQSEIQSRFGDLNSGIALQYGILENLIGIKNSPAYPDTASFSQFPSSVSLSLYREPSVSGGLNMAGSVSDALVMQYYEEPDEQKAGFGRSLSFEEWEEVSAVKEWYQAVLFTAPSVAVNVAHPMLLTMLSEIQDSCRAFSFLCGHDSNIGSVLAALYAEPYELPATIEKSTPIGGKLVIETFLGSDGVRYADLWMVYASTAQVRKESSLSYRNPPMAEQILLTGLKSNADGLYSLVDLEQRFREAIEAYEVTID